MSKLGIGGARVDLILDRAQYSIGEKLTGTLIVQGGTVEQTIDGITIDMMMDLRIKDKAFTKSVYTFPVTESFIIYEEERKEFPISFDLPHDLMISSRTVSYYFQTNLKIVQAADHQDHDRVIIAPTEALEKVFMALQELGFKETYDSRSFDGIAQKFEFSPTNANGFNGQIKKVMFIVAVEEKGIQLLLEVVPYQYMPKHTVLRQELSLTPSILTEKRDIKSGLSQVMNEMIDHSTAYTHRAFRMNEIKTKNNYPLKGAIGGMVAGLIGGVVLSEILEQPEWEEQTESLLTSVSYDEGYLGEGYVEETDSYFEDMQREDDFIEELDDSFDIFETDDDF